jgi:hypothetical protein
MTDPSALAAALPGSLTCANCGDGIQRGYVAATTEGSDYTLHVDDAVCDTCGWSERGSMGCAPLLSDFETGDLLLRVEREGDALAPAAITDRADG